MLKGHLDLPQSPDVSLHHFLCPSPLGIPHFPQKGQRVLLFFFFLLFSVFSHAKGAFVVFIYTVVAAGDPDQGCKGTYAVMLKLAGNSLGLVFSCLQEISWIVVVIA